MYDQILTTKKWENGLNIRYINDGAYTDKQAERTISGLAKVAVRLAEAIQSLITKETIKICFTCVICVQNKNKDKQTT